MYDIFTLAKYPFLSEAKKWVREEKVDIHEILYEPAYERVRMRAVERVENALKYGTVKNATILKESDCVIEIFSYPVARMIVVDVESDYLRRRYALAEAKRAYENLKEEDMDFIEKISDEFGMDVRGEHIHFSDYLKYAPTWDLKWKLVNRVMEKGYVRLSKEEISRLLQEAIRNKIQNELLYLFSIPDIKNVFGEEIRRFKSKVMPRDMQRVEGINEKAYPPCIKNIMNAIKSRMNVPHVARFTLVTFMNAIGASIDEILKIFSSSPDFNEERTRYQIEHITGKISGTTYSVPKCSTLRTWGLCYPDELCKKINHPLMYYRLKRRKNELSEKKVS